MGKVIYTVVSLMVR